MQKNAEKTYEISGGKRIVASVMLSIFISTVSPFSLCAEKLEKNSGIITTLEREEKTEVLISAKNGGKVELGAASIEIPEGALKKDTKISITHLRKVKDTGESLYNAIPKFGGYRFLPKGTKFTKEAVIALPYSKELNEKPQSLEELYTYFYDTEKNCWVKLERLEVDKEKCLVRSLTTHFTDMINATLTLPESASPADINLNSIKNLEAAKPDSHLIKFNAPKATSTGDASFSFELGIPAGRKGMQPQITVNYSSGGGNGIMGKGFDVNFGSSITTDTRLGLPKYDTNDTYMLDGILLSEKERKTEGNETKVIYKAEKESSFSRIVRYGAGTENDFWEVTEKNGTKRTYAQSALSCAGSGKATFTWNITKIQDVNGNNVEYEYIKDSGHVYPGAIYYTGFGGKKGNYKVQFHYDGDGKDEERKDVRIEARSKELVSRKKLLTAITAHYKDEEAMRTYSFEYTEGLAKEKMMTTVRVSNNAGERYEYTFKYNEAEKDGSGNLIYFAEAEEWNNGKALQVGNTTRIGSSFNASAGVGYGTRFIDVRGTGGASGSVSTGESCTEETMADINGDGKPDAISQEGNRIYVSLNNGNGFEEKRAITISEGSFSGEIDKEENTSSTIGWNVYGGAGIKASKISVSAGAGYSEVYQSTSSSVLSSFMDVNQDGLIDIVESGKKYYLRNCGNLKFTKAEILTNSIINDVSQDLSLDEKNEYQKTYFVQNPFRVWKSPYEGFITIEEKTKGLSENSRSNIKAKTFIGEDIEYEKEVIGSGSESKKSYAIEKDKNIYFITDFGNEPKNTDIEWNVNIEYSEIKSLKKDFKSVIFVPEELPAKKVYSNQKSEEDAVKEFKEILPDPLLIELYEVSTEKKQAPDGNESYSVTFGYSDKWKESENLLGICGALVKAGYFMPTTFTKEEFREYLNGTDNIAEKKQETEKLEYYKKFASQFDHKAAEDIFIIKPFEKDAARKEFYENYPLSDKLKEKCMEKYNIEGIKTYFTDREFLYGNSKTYSAETQKRNEDESGTIFEKDGKVLYNIGSVKSDNQNIPIFYNATDKKIKCADTIFSSAKVAKTEENAGENQLSFSIFYNYDKNGKAESEIKFKVEEISYRPENISASEFKRIFDFINVEHTDVHEKHWDWEKGKTVKEAETESLFAGMSLSADEKKQIIKSLYGEKQEKYDEENENTEYYYTIKENPDYKAAQEILTAYKKRVVLEKEFPFYEEQADGGYEIKDFWKTEKTESEILDLYGEETGNSPSSEKYEEYKSLNSKLSEICESLNIGKSGKILCAIEYEKEHLYRLENNKHNLSGFYSMLQLDAEENEGILLFTKQLEPFKTIWNSKKDYDTENVTEKFCVYEYEITEEIKGEKYSGTNSICVNNGEFLYGGKNNWFYGIWKSSWQEDSAGNLTEKNPFSEKNLMTFESAVTEINSEQEFEEKAKEAENINAETPEKEESETNIYFYLPTTKEKSEQVKDVENLENAETEYLSSSVQYDKALLGTVCVNTFLEKDKDGKKNPVTEYYMPFIYGDTIHADRAGGPSYYTIEGLYAQSNSGSEDMQENITIPTIRKTYTKGTDRTPNISVSLGGSAAETVSKLDDAGKVSEYATRIAENGFTGSTSKGTNESESEIKQAFQDINGDGIPDIIQVDSKKSKVTAVLSSGVQKETVLYSEQTELENISVLGKSSGKTDVYGGSVSPGGNISVTPSGLKKMSLKTEQKASASPSGGITYSKGENFQSAGFSDINGDGLCDYYDGGSYKLNSGGKFVSGAEICSGFSGTGNLYKGTSQTFGMNFSVGKGANLLQANSLSSGASVNLGLSYSFSSSNTEKIMLDINGDGLQDVMEMSAGGTEISVRYNTGCGFTDKQKIKLPEWGKIIEENSGKFLTQADSGGYDLGFVDDIPVVGTMLKGSLGAVSVNPFGFLAKEKANSLEWTSSTTVGFSGSAGANVNIGFDIWALFVYCGTINITGSMGSGVNASATINGATVKMLDLDGDGLADQVLRIPGYGTYWKRNISGLYGKLNKINLPQGGNVQIEYAEKYGTTANPIFKYVLSKVVMNDGCNETLPNIEHGEHSVTTIFEYDDGYYDRQKKDFYGFGKVKTTFTDGTYKLENYYNDSYYAKGVLKESEFYSENGSLLSRNKTELCEEPYALPAVEENWNYEKASGNENFIYTKTEYEYDDFGNCIKITQDFGDEEQLTAKIEYDNSNETDYIIGLPLEICVYGKNDVLLRRRSGSYNSKGELTELRQYFDSSNYSKNTLTYDNFGNIKSVCDSRGATLSYVYDKGENMFVTEIAQHGKNTDIYKSTINYDVATQTKTSETDCRGNTFRYEYDAWQRIAKIFTSYDSETPAVSYGYYAPEKTTDNGAKLWYTVTNNKVTFGSDDESVIQTVLQIDGLGRAVRTAKTGFVNGVLGWNASGAVEYDKKGREVKKGVTEFIQGENVSGLLSTTPKMTELFTKYEYDEKDRAVKTTLPDGSVQKESYYIEENNLVSESTDPLENVTTQKTDSRGNIVSVQKFDKDGKQQTKSTYKYNEMGEMLKAYDAKGNPITAEYDLLGRRTAIESLDSGRQEFFYDESSNLVRENNSVLRENNKQILYEYDGLNRLVRIDYPDTEDTKYVYGGANNKNGAAGKILSVTDASGSISYEYGKLGEVTKETRTLKTHLNRSNSTEKAVMEYRSDYLGRMQYIVYPDGEKVTYGYDAGGQVVSVTGEHFGREFKYVTNILYDEYGQRTRIDYGNGTFTEYSYDKARRWLDTIKTQNKWGKSYQNIVYSFDKVGNVLGYENDCLESSNGNYKTSQKYEYDSLYQLTKVAGETIYNPYASSVPEFKSNYSQTFSFDADGLGNMTSKVSTENVTPQKSVGDNLNYAFDYVYDENYAHRLLRAGERYYKYDANGNVICEQDGSFDLNGDDNATYHKVTKEADDVYSTDYGWGLFKETDEESESGTKATKTYRRTYTWNERNQLVSSVDANYSTAYIYGQDGERTNKYTSQSETLYFNKMWTLHTDSGNAIYGGQFAKNIFLGETRIVTKLNSGENPTYSEECNKQYFYHSDHLGSASLISDSNGDEYQRIEYTPYGETWVEKTNNTGLEYLPYKFTAKEQDEETGLYYYGARYLDSRYSRWISTDPALGDYVPQAPISDEAKKHNQNLPGMGGVFNHINGNLYHYAGNNPVKYTDPTGMWIDNEDGTYTAEKGDTLWDLYGNDWQEKSGYEGDPTKLQVGDVVGNNKENLCESKIENNNIIESYNKKESVWKTWSEKPTGANLTNDEATLQRNLGTGEMIIGPIAGVGLSYFGPEAFTLGMYVMADGAIVVSEANKNRKFSPFASLPTFLLPYASTTDGKYMFYTGY